jgi:hypothetical protein
VRREGSTYGVADTARGVVDSPPVAALRGGSCVTSASRDIFRDRPRICAFGTVFRAVVASAPSQETVASGTGLIELEAGLWLAEEIPVR